MIGPKPQTVTATSTAARPASRLALSPGGGVTSAPGRHGYRSIVSAPRCCPDRRRLARAAGIGRRSYVRTVTGERSYVDAPAEGRVRDGGVGAARTPRRTPT